MRKNDRKMFHSNRFVINNIWIFYRSINYVFFTQNPKGGKMITITQRGRWAYVNKDIDPKVEAALFNRMKYKRMGAEYMPNPAWAWVKLYNRKQKKFPIGLTHIAEPVLTQWKVKTGEDYQILSEAEITGFCFNNELDLRDYQMDAIKHLYVNNGGILCMPTGSGKTRTMLGFFKNVKYKNALIVVPSIELKNQWLQELEKYGIKARVETYQYLFLHKLGLENHDIVVFDECHHVSARTIYSVAMSCSKAITIGLSATPYRIDGHDMKIHAALGKIVYQVKLKTLQDKEYLCRAKVNLIDLQEFDPEPYDSYHEIYDTWIVNNNERNEKIIDIAETQPDKRTTLILIDKIAHGALLSKKLLERDIPHLFVYGESKDRKQKLEEINQGKHNLIIASNIYGEGVDIPRLHTLIIAAGGKSSIKIVQQTGRLLRMFPGKEKAVIYDFIDSGKYLEEHYEERLKIYKENFEV